ncbi:MAG: deoxyribodipyrimidine photo-lyase [candidate division KSB1 bacterium]|nr:deoxyribodipyrimidine photo-lyase [candidate division KSB1 bacterium]
MIQPERIKKLNDESVQDRRYVLYWMQASQRVEFNHALQYAIMRANELKKPVVVYFGLTDDFPEANARHYHFMLQGLREVEESLRDLGIRFIIRKSSPDIGAVSLSRDADLVVVDRGYLKVQRTWRKNAADKMDCPLIQVESDVVVPVELASPKEEWAAATFRPKITKLLDRFFTAPPEYRPQFESFKMSMESFNIDDVDAVVKKLKLDGSVSPVSGFTGGTRAAHSRLQHFIENKLDKYDELRNDPSLDYLSHMSPYLHFGQISPLYIALQLKGLRSPGEEAYLEEMIVRRELSMNFVFYNVNYDSYDSLPDWSRKTLEAHLSDPRMYHYDLKTLENAETHDPYWNAAQKEMMITGKMHGYMRMYWGKKILEWNRSPGEAFDVAVYLNNKYELDGRDPNGFTGVAWCFGKHDRAWFERDIFGKVRYMNANGLKRKFDIGAYVEKVDKL